MVFLPEKPETVFCRYYKAADNINISIAKYGMICSTLSLVLLTNTHTNTLCLTLTSSSAIAERPRSRVGQFWQSAILDVKRPFCVSVPLWGFRSNVR